MIGPWVAVSNIGLPCCDAVLVGGLWRNLFGTDGCNRPYSSKLLAPVGEDRCWTVEKARWGNCFSEFDFRNEKNEEERV